MFEYLNFRQIKASTKRYSEAYQASTPFKHIEIRNLVLPEKLGELTKAFPAENWDYWKMYPSEHAPLTKVCASTLVLPLAISRLIFELNSGPFLKLLQKITGIENLLPDPHLRGAGMHMTLPGGTLTPHIDHHLYSEHPRYRQLNLILYLTEGWSEENQGNFELWDSEYRVVHKEIVPSHGACLLFRTSDSSMHGFSKPVKNENRRSIALFYYTATGQTEHYGGGQATYWQPTIMKATNSGEALRLFLQQIMWASARTLAKLSWYCQRAATHLTHKPK